VKRNGTSTSLTADIDGNIDGGTAVWAGTVRGGPARLQLAGELTDKKISVERLHLTGRTISLLVKGTVDRTDAHELDGRLDLSLPDLASVSPVLAGTLNLSGKVKGPGTSLSADTELTSTLSIHGSPPGTVSATIHAGGLPKSPRGTVEAHGDLDGAPLQLSVEVQRAEGDVVHAMIRRADWKSAHADGDLTSGADFARARGNVRFRMSQLSDLNRLLGSTLQGSLGGSLGFTPVAGRSRAQIQLEAKDVAAGGITTNAQLNASGTMAALDVKLAAQSPAIGGEPASVNSTAQLNVTAKEVHLASLQASYHDQTVKLLSPAKLSFADGFAIDGLKLGAQEAVLEVNGRVSPALDIRASLKQLKPDLINAFVPRLLAGGTIQADAQVQGSFAAPTGKLHVEALGMRAANDAARGLPATDLRADAQLLGNKANVDAKLTAGSASHLALTGEAPLAAAGALDLKLAGNLDMTLLNPLLEAGGRHVTGAIAIDTTVTGAAASPDIGGKVRLTKGSFRTTHRESTCQTLPES